MPPLGIGSWWAFTDRNTIQQKTETIIGCDVEASFFGKLFEIEAATEQKGSRGPFVQAAWDDPLRRGILLWQGILNRPGGRRYACDEG